MRRFRGGPGWRTWGVVAVLAVFVACGLQRYRDADGDDLASSYVGCRLVTTGDESHLYSYDPVDFAAVGPDDKWQGAADAGEFEGFLHPYVQTPLWAYALQPVCRGDFATFEQLFLWATLLAFAGCFWLAVRFWAPVLWSPYAVGAGLLGLWFCEPFRYAMSLMQTHVLFLLMTIASLILAERRKPGWAGLLLAMAAAIKITPAVLVLYWALTRRWMAALSMMLWSAVLGVLAAVVSGRDLFGVYLADLRRISRVLLLAYNNQALAAWWLGRFHPGQVGLFTMLPLPDAMRLGSMLLMVMATTAGGWLDGRREEVGHGRGEPPLGAMVALIAGTVFAPIAWTHYSIVLIAPLLLLCQEAAIGRKWWIWVVAVVIYALNVQPLATRMEDNFIRQVTLVRSEFYAEVICMAALALLAWKGRAAVARSL